MDEDTGEHEERIGPDGHSYEFPEGGTYGWRMGDKEGVCDGNTTCNYFLTDSVEVWEMEDVMIWDAETQEELEALWEEWTQSDDDEVRATKVFPL